MPAIRKLNEDDLKEIFANRKPHLSFGSRRQPEELVYQFEIANNSDKEIFGNRVADAKRCWGKVPFEFMDRIRDYTATNPPRPREKRRELVDALAPMVDEGVNVERLMQAAISCSIFTNEQLQILEDNRPVKTEFTARELAIKQGMGSKKEIRSRVSLINAWWKRSRNKGSENPMGYLRTTIAETSIEELERMCRADDTIEEMARECGVLNVTINNYFINMRASERETFNKYRSSPI